jgi:hypothetical protein
MIATPPSNGLKFVIGKRIDLKKHSEFDESWVERQIEQQPSILGLGEGLEYVSSQLTNSNGGRLDLLLKDEETVFSVELMLGALDGEHIVRSLDYWLRNQARPQYPKPDYEHVAVLVAERILSRRFTDVARFLSSRVNLIVIELAAIQVEQYVALHCTTIFDGTPTVEDDVEQAIVSGLGDWPSDLKSLMENVVELAKPVVNGSVELNPRNDDRVGVRVGNRVNNFIVFAPKRKFLRVEAKVSDPEAWAAKLKEAGFDVLGSYRGSRVRFHLTPQLFQEHQELVGEVCVESAKAWFE